jgi:hypothetical protein
LTSPPPPTNIIFETSNLTEDMRLLIIEKDQKFEVYLYNTFSHDAMIMTISDVHELAKMFDALGPYFHQREEI